eukprot:30330_1
MVNSCYDERSKNGGIWLDDLGRSCLYYEKFNDTCANDEGPHPCCICRNKKSLSINEAVYVTEYDPVWAIVVVAFCLLLICILFHIILFQQALYRNEKRKTFRLQKANTQRHIASHTVTSKSDISKTDLEIEDEYAAIPGDIGVGKKQEKNKTDNFEEYDEEYDEYDDHFEAHSQPQPQPQPSTFKVRTSLKALSKTTERKQDHHSTNSIDEYAVIDDMKTKPKTTTIALKSKPHLLEGAYHQSTRRRYSAELEFNALPDKNRQRHSSKFNHAYHHTQDDMIFLSYEQYLENEEEQEIDDKPTLTSKERFSRMSTRRVVKLFAPQEIKYNDIDFSGQEFIGKGSFGVVVKAKYHEIDVAVKKLHTQRLSGAELLNFKREAAIMQKVGGHKHIARMYGFCTKPEICIVTEYYARGSLHDIIKNKKTKIKKRITTELKIQMTLEASLGIWHLHRQQVIHRDISARNLLVDENWTVVVADLGMSRFKGNEVSKGKNIGPVKWMAPESIIGNEYSEKSDSYSFGITLYEIFSESEPYPGLLPLEAGAKVVHEGIRPCIDKNKKIEVVPNLSKLLSMLWKPQPKDRPDFLFITQSLKKIKKQWMIKKKKYIS